MKNITLLAVKLAALLDIETNGSTTTLDVKNILRTLDIDARQDQVSDLLEQAANELPLDYSTNGTFRTYTLSDPSAVVALDGVKSNDEDDDDALSSGLTYTKRNGTTITAFDDELDASDNDWMVNSATTDEVLYFSGHNSRDEVRQAFSGLTGVRFWDVRANRI